MLPPNLSPHGLPHGPSLGAEARNIRIGRGAIPDEHKSLEEMLFTAVFAEGIASLEDLWSSGQASFTEPWPQEVLGILVGRVVQPSFAPVEAWKEIPRGAVTAVVDSVRNKILSFALEIEAANPAAGDVAPSTEPPLPQERVQQIALTVIGDRNIFAAGPGANVHNVTQVNAGDWDGLSHALLGLGVEEEDVEALRKALGSDHDAEGTNGLGPAAERWIGRMTATAVSGASKVAPETVGGVITGLILSFLGIA